MMADSTPTKITSEIGIERSVRASNDARIAGATRLAWSLAGRAGILTIGILVVGYSRVWQFKYAHLRRCLARPRTLVPRLRSWDRPLSARVFPRSDGWIAGHIRSLRS